MSLSLSNLTSVLTSLGSSVSTLTPSQLASSISSGLSLLGPSSAEQSLGKDLDIYKTFRTEAFNGNAAAAGFATQAQISISGIVGLPSSVTNLLPTVFDATDMATLDSAIGQVKNAAGL